LDIVDGLNYLYPAIPGLTYRGEEMDIGPHITGRPWDAVGSMRLDFYPCHIGLAYLLPQDIIFSTWFFYLAGKAQLILGSATGIMESSPEYPYFGMQAAGAVLVLALVALWEARGYLAQVGRLIAGSGKLDDRHAARS